MEETKEIIEGQPFQEYIKLYKNSKGYNWEIKKATLDPDEIECLNNEMLNKFGGDVNG